MKTKGLPSERDESHPWRKFVVTLSLLVAVLVLGILVGSLGESERRFRTDELYRARSYFTQIVVTRKWNAELGGVYALKRPGVESNPYLRDPDILLADGRVATLRNPSLMTRELSEIAEKDGLFKFRITSLKPLNPGNAPDGFERAALEAFARRESAEIIELKKRDGRFFNRYIAPLYVDRSCLGCHGDQGYRIGDIRGGISVEFDVTELRRALDVQRIVFAAVSSLALAFLIAVLSVSVGRLRRRVNALNEKILEMAVTDALTGLPNRHRFLARLDEEASRAERTGQPFSVGMLDIDHFKLINDAHGHPVGDIVLKEAARRLAACVRLPDMVARFGGEEFAVVFSGVRCKDAAVAAERMRAALADSPILAEGKEISVTISGGVAEVPAGGAGTMKSSATAALAEADKALYRAKHGGRNRVELA